MIKKLFLAGLVLSLGASSMVYAEGETTGKTSFAMTNWLSKNLTDPVSIQNGTGFPLIISITVDKNSAAVNVKNCGTTTHINPGSSTICMTSDARNPVTMISESGTTPASGTYQINPVTR